MLIFELNKTTGEYRCYDDQMDWIHLSGFGPTKQKAEIDFFLNQPWVNPNPATIISTDS